jgi:LytS/YehU family sensor histidine kinase
MEETELLFLFFIGFVVFLILFIRSDQAAKKLQQEIQQLKQAVVLRNQKIADLQKESDSLKGEIDRLETENMRFVLNPHSFRNTLSSIQNLATRTYKSVVGLSGIMDFMLYDSRQPMVALEKELDFLKEYVNIYLIQLKAGIRKEIKTDLGDSPGFAESHLIAPMITASFVENAFKHGDMDSDESFISVQIRVVADHTIEYSVRNGIRRDGNSRQSGGLGQETMIKRLNKLYPNLYHFESSAENMIYTATLRLTLHEKQALVHSGR